jgi:hypothetical protein
MSATPEATQEILTRFRLDGIREHVRRIWAAIHGSEERGPSDYPPWDDERRILINIIRRQADRGFGGNNATSGSGGNWKAIAIVMGALVTITLVWLAWFSNTVIQTREDVQVIKCQLNPNQCPQVAPRAH